MKWLIEHSTTHQLLWYIDSFVLRNPPLRQAPKRCVQLNLKMKQLFSILIVFVTSNLVIGQIWKYPNLPYGFEHLKNEDRYNSKKGIEFETIIIIQGKDTIHQEKNYYDSLGRSIKRIFKDDTTIYEYNNGLLVSKSSQKIEGKEMRYFNFNEKGQLLEFTIVSKEDTLDNIKYGYSEKSKFPTSVEYNSYKREERVYNSNNKLKKLLTYELDNLTDSITYFYSGDTVKYTECTNYNDEDVWGCQKTYGIYDNKRKLIKIVSEIQEGDKTVISTTKSRYNKKGQLIKTTDILSNGSKGKTLYYYDKNNFMIRVETFSEGKKQRTILYTNLVKK